MGLDGFRQGMDAIQAEGKKRGGGHGFVSYDLRLDIPIKESDVPGSISEAITLLDAQYTDQFKPELVVPYYRFQQHRFQTPKGTRTFTCAGDGCYGCQQYAAGKDWAQAKTFFSMNLMHWAWYHDAQKMDRGGQLVFSRKDPNSPIMTKVPCESQMDPTRCRYCQAGYQRVYGAHRYIELGQFHFETLYGFQKNDLDKTCITCRTNIKTLRYYCSGCQQYYVPAGSDHPDLDYWAFKDRKEKAERLTKIDREPQQCRHQDGSSCGHVGLLKAVRECGYDPQGNPAQGGGCASKEPKVLDIFDTVIYIYRLKGKITTLAHDGITALAAFQPHNGQPVQTVISEVYKQPFDFKATYTPKSPDELARFLGFEHIPAAPSGPPGFQNYGQQPQQPAWAQGGAPAIPGPPVPRPPYGNR